MNAYALQNPLLRKRTAAALLGVSPTTVDRLAKAGRLPCVRVGGSVRFVLSDLEGFVQTNRKGVS
jgi:excisionase family DNA binding protein